MIAPWVIVYTARGDKNLLQNLRLQLLDREILLQSVLAQVACTNTALSLLGCLRTDRKQLCVAVKEKLRAGEFHLKFKGLLNTVTGGWQNALWLHRTASFQPSGFSMPQRRGAKHQGKVDPRVRLGAGVFIDAKDGQVVLKDDVHLNCRGRAQWQLWDYERHQVDVDISYNPQGKRVRCLATKESSC